MFRDGKHPPLKAEAFFPTERDVANSSLNIDGLMIAEAVGEGMVRIIPDDPAGLERLLKKHGFHFVKEDVLAIDLSNKPGALAEATEKLGQGGINIQYAYATGLANCKKVMVILKVSDQSKALSLSI